MTRPESSAEPVDAGSGEAITGKLLLKKGREKPIIQGHPWIFSGAVAAIKGEPSPGDLVLITAANGRELGLAYYNPKSQIVGRILSDPYTEINADFWRERITQAYALRRSLNFHHNRDNGGPETNTYRLVNAESDHLPGLVVDRYGPYLVMQVLTLGIERRKADIIELLAALPLPDGGTPAGIIEKSDATVRKKEGLSIDFKIHSGHLPTDGDGSIEPITVLENGLRFQVNLATGHKSGFYLDQRENRALLQTPRYQRYLAGKRVLNCFAYTGGFAVYAAAAGAAEVVNVDTSIPALEMAEANVLLNHPDRQADSYLAGDAFEVLRHFDGNGEQFDLVILDPPKFVNSKQDIERASRGYKDINRLGMRLTRPGGLLMTYSCSGLLSEALFQKIIFGAAVDAGSSVQILQGLGQGPDHPYLATFPEGKYLKGFLCRVD